MPSRKYLTTELLTDHYNMLYASISKYLSLTSKVCLTMDIWINRQTRSYLGVTGHFIKDFKLQSIMLSCCRFRGSHKGENIMHQFEEIVALFDITGKVDKVITDNASNMKKAFRLLDINDGEVQSDSSENEGYDEYEVFLPIETDEISIQLDFHPLVPIHHSCFDHTLQLVVKDGLKNVGPIQRILRKISNLVSHVRYSSQACDLFEKDLKLQWLMQLGGTPS